MRRPVMLLDSGAFTAWTQKTEISVEEYGRFCLAHLDDFDYFANLDVIPGEFGQKDLPREEIERSASLGWQNYKTLLGMGLPREKLIHIFHQGEDFKWLTKMVKAMPYIGLSPANDRTRAEKIVWLDQCMKFVTDDKGMPIVKFHGFAVTSFKIMTRYPWFSVDSTSWIMAAALGGVYVPQTTNGDWDYTKEAMVINLSEHSPSRAQAGKHLKTLPLPQQQKIASYFEHRGFPLGRSVIEKVPHDYVLKDGEKWRDSAAAREKAKEKKGSVRIERIEEEGLCNNPEMRGTLNMLFILSMQDALPQWPWAFQPKSKGLLF